LINVSINADISYTKVGLSDACPVGALRSPFKDDPPLLKAVEAIRLAKRPANVLFNDNDSRSGRSHLSEKSIDVSDRERCEPQ
jgi:hypothetical protein